MVSRMVALTFAGVLNSHNVRRVGTIFTKIKLIIIYPHKRHKGAK